MKPTIGTIIESNGKRYRVIAVYQFGTIDVETLNGQHFYRITGLSFL